jgi:hypothetical protein
MISWLGRVTPGFRATIAGAFQLVISPVKMPHATAAFNLRVVIPGTLYIKLRPPATIGMYSKGQLGALSPAASPW